MRSASERQPCLKASALYRVTPSRPALQAFGPTALSCGCQGLSRGRLACNAPPTAGPTESSRANPSHLTLHCNHADRQGGQKGLLNWPKETDRAGSFPPSRQPETKRESQSATMSHLPLCRDRCRVGVVAPSNIALSRKSMVDSV